ncbi:MAG TPA: fluoride efflux transporter CrcB [Mycobacteriales bacterium]|jgi:CrcB protein|nr:fluoride efflux transporter CrcB [Mycobacteriales bacterium]
MSWLLVALLGAVGAPARYYTDRAVQERTTRRLPWGTLVVNVSGSFVLGLLTALSTHHGLDHHVELAFGTGLCGAFTTWSTWSFETVRLLEDGKLCAATLHAVGSLGLGLLAAAAGLGLGTLGP